MVGLLIYILQKGRYKMSKKILAVLLSLAMLGSAANLPVFAENEEAETVEVMETVEAEETEEASVPYAEDEIISEETESAETEESNAKNEFDNIWNVALMATEETDQTYSFENIDIVAHDITGLSNDIDYVIYYKDGSVSEYNWDRTPSKLSVPAGGKAIITSTNRTVKSVFADEYFLVNEEENPAMNKVTINLYETYTYTNTSNVAYNVLSGGSADYDYILYDADGNVSNYVYDTWASSIRLRLLCCISASYTHLLPLFLDMKKAAAMF